MCELCLGRLGNEGDHGRWSGDACRVCLTYPATEDVRHVALVGWNADEWPRWRGWFFGSYKVDGIEHAKSGPMLPLHLPAGRDIAVRVLAVRVGIQPDESLHFHVEAGCLEIHSEHGTWTSGPLAIPRDAPADLRAGRALALCLAATEPTPDA